jgi:hypothetical protein
MPPSVDDLEVLIDKLSGRSVAYAVGLYSYLYSSPVHRLENVLETLKPAFGENVANEVYSEICKIFEENRGRVKATESIWENLKKHVLEGHICRLILDEAEKRLNQAPEHDKKILSTACAVIDVLVDKDDYPVFSIEKEDQGFIKIPLDSQSFSDVVSSLLGLDSFKVEDLLYKYLLGFQGDFFLRERLFRVCRIYPFLTNVIKKLASEAQNHVRILTKSDVESELNELYRKGDFLKLALMDHLSSHSQGSVFLSDFFGKPFDHLAKAITIGGIMNKGFVNPLICNHIREAMESLRNRALKELTELFKSVFEENGYSSTFEGNCYTFVKSMTRPIDMYFLPWPREIGYEEGRPESIKVMVVQGIPSRLIPYNKTLLWYSSKGFLWVFVGRRKVVIASNTYRAEDHRNILKVLSSRFPIEFLGPEPSELAELRKCTFEMLTEVVKCKGNLGTVRRLSEFLTQLIISERSVVVYSELIKFGFPNLKYLDRVLDSLIRSGHVYARYTGPAKKYLPVHCRRVHSLSDDPWIQDRRRSGALKIWLFGYTANEKLRKRRRSCWGPYIEIYFTPLINAIRARLRPKNQTSS